MTGAAAQDHAVAAYLRIPPAGWWTRPTAAAPVTAIVADGTRTCSLATSDGDQYAIELIAFLIPLACQPPVLDAALRLPEALYAYPYAQTIRCPRLRFANCDWMVKRINGLIGRQKDTWTYEGIAFYVWPEGRQPPGTCPAHRFRAAGTGNDFHMASESEKDKLVKDHPKLWTCEGIAWHAYRLRAESSVGRAQSCERWMRIDVSQWRRSFRLFGVPRLRGLIPPNEF